MSSIRVLDSFLVNQIASGQVVDRPASVVKELVENALDAGASEIEVSLQDGGQSLIRVVDNGCGMSLQDLELCVERHATSKLSDGDLFRIQTFGFRGEALPSIGAVARLNLTSRHKGATETQAWSLSVEGGAKGQPVPDTFPYPSGTKVEVRDLFFATPARLKFMKSATTELSHVQDMFQRLALANPTVGFRLVDGKRELFNSSAGEELEQRLAAVLGGEFVESKLDLDLEQDGYHLCGAMGVPTYHRGTPTKQYVFVNGRVVKDRWIGSLIRAAYQDVMPKERHPVGMLSLNLPMEEVDMNVHPAKTEVKFRDMTRVRALVMVALKQALQGVGHPSDHSLSTQMLQAFTPAYKTAQSSPRGVSYESFSREPSPSPALRELQAEFRTREPFSNPTPVLEIVEQAIPETLQGFQEAPLGDALAQIQRCYIVSQTSDALILVDQHAAHERLVYERLKQQLEQGQIPSKTLLIPEIVALSPLAVERLQAQFSDLATLGLVLETFGQDSVLIREVPEALDLDDLKQMVQDLAAELETLPLPEGGPEKLQRLLQEVAAAKACQRGSIKSGKPLNKVEMNALLRDMEQTPHSGQCNHGRPTFIRLSLKDLERLFGRHD